MKKILIASLAALSFTSLNASASDTNPWTQCGIGAAIFEDLPIAAAISNVIWDLGTTAVSSYASSKDTCQGSKMKTAAAEFIQNSYASLEEELAKGHGQHLSAMLDLFEINADKQSAVIGSIRAEFADLYVSEKFATLSTTEKSQALYFLVQKQA